jgi:hypothetical protein
VTEGGPFHQGLFSFDQAQHSVRRGSLAATKFDGIYDGISGRYRHPIQVKDTVMPLTDTRIRNAKPQAKAYKLSDGGSMYLLVKPDGGRYWRLDYRFAGKRRTLALGVYPITTLSSARIQRDEAASVARTRH